MRMATAALALLLVAPVAAAAVPDVRQCTQYGCVIVQDTNGDGEVDWANVATSVDHALTFNANLHAGALLVGADASSEETTEPYAAGVVLLFVDASDGLHRAWVYGEAYTGDEETGETEHVAWQFVEAWDSDDDGVPDSYQTLP